jgi:hypothetical protein
MVHNHLLTATDQQHLLAQAEALFHLVWRFDFTAPGFCLIDVGPAMDSYALRSSMVALKEWLSGIAVRRDIGPFAFKSMGRFDQQETTKFHLDGGPLQSMLMLGYESSQVRSRLFLADYSRAAFDQGITPQQFMHDVNPMYRRGEELLDRHVTELPEPDDGHSRILLINNSSLPFTDARTNSLGVMHKAIIDTPDETERRIVNSTTLVLGDADEVGQEKQQDFVRTDEISKKQY